MNKLSRMYWTAKGVGWDNLPRRLLQALRVRSGLLRRKFDPAKHGPEAFEKACPNVGVADQTDRWRKRAERFFPRPSAEMLNDVADDATWKKRVTEPTEKLLAGEYPMFSRWSAELGWPPRFNFDPVNGIEWPVGEHWTNIAYSGPPRDDIKLVWEASRLSAAFLSARQYARGGEDRWAEAFWTLLEAWLEQNPPQMTANWGCGQEIGFRLMAVLFGTCATLDSPAATPQRLYAATRLAWQSGRNIATNLNYARSQKNNHALSEAAALLAVGLLFEQLPEARKWEHHARRTLLAEAKRQIYDDGSYVQHSMNYHRVMLDDLLFAAILSERCGRPLDQAVRDRIERATHWLAQMIEPSTGRVPNYGANDGANVLPLNACDYLDYRPTVQTAWGWLYAQRYFPPGAWDEKPLWLLGPTALGREVQRPARKAIFAARRGGYYLLRGANSQALLRCHSYRDRPGQADMLHVDLFHRGRNVLRDGGSYRYYCPAPWRAWFASTAAHNTVRIGETDQMTKGPRFLWFYWSRCRLEGLATSPDGQIGWVCGQLLNYDELPVRHRRGLCRINDVYLVLDEITGRGSHAAELRWRLLPEKWQSDGENAWCLDLDGEAYAARLHMPDAAETRLLEGVEEPQPEGWESLYYGEKTPAPTLLASCEADLDAGPLRLLSVFGPARQMDRLARLESFAEGNVQLRRPDGADLTPENLEELTEGRFRYV